MMKTEHYRTKNKRIRNIAKEPPIRKTLLLAHQIQTMVSAGKIKHPRDVCPWIHINETRLDQIMNTLFLSPTIQEEILSENPDINKLNEYSIRSLTTTVDWNIQSRQWRELLSSTK